MLELDSRADDRARAHSTRPADAPARDGRVGARRLGPDRRGRAEGVLHAAAAAGGATVVGEEFYAFPNGAVTGVLLLAQSHLSIHTWPELRSPTSTCSRAATSTATSCWGRSASASTSSGRTSAASSGPLTEERRIVREVAAAVGLAEGERGVRAVLATLARLEPVSTRRISRAAELPVPIVAAVCGELRKRSVVAEERPTQLTPAGRELFAGGSLRSAAGRVPRLQRARDRRPGRALAARARALEAVRGGPPARLELDQCHCTVDTKLRRLLAIHEAGALVGRRVLLLGDDDLTALALQLSYAATARLRRSRASRSWTSIPRWSPSSSASSRTRRSRSRCIEHDLRRPLPPELVGAFDTVVTDPPYTTAAARLFLSRAADALDGGRGDVFLSFGSRRPGAAVQLQRAIAEIGFVIQRLSRDFNEYVGAGVLGGTSHLYHLAATDELAPAVTGSIRRRRSTPPTRPRRRRSRAGTPPARPCRARERR